MNSSTSGWSTSRTTIFAARRVAPPDLIVPAEASAPRMNETGPLAVPPEDSSSLLERIRERFTPAPEPPLKIRPSSRYQSRIESIVSSTARMKQAQTCCGECGPDVEPDRRVEAEHLVEQRVGQLVLEDLGVARAWRSSRSRGRPGVGADHAVDELLEAPLALGRADRAAEVLGRDDVGRVDRPEVGELDAALLEVDRAVPPVGHDDVAALPGDLVVGVDALTGVDAAHREPLLALLPRCALTRSSSRSSCPLRNPPGSHRGPGQALSRWM